jgi:hypothetical protein
MSSLSFLKDYCVDSFDNLNIKQKHAFVKVSDKDIIEAEIKMGQKFPKELKKFYLEIGKGIFYINDKEKEYRNILM